MPTWVIEKPEVVCVYPAIAGVSGKRNYREKQTARDRACYKFLNGFFCRSQTEATVF
jgi:hypothetical protein